MRTRMAFGQAEEEAGAVGGEVAPRITTTLCELMTTLQEQVQRTIRWW